MKKKSGLMRLEELEIEPLTDEVLRSVMGTVWDYCSMTVCSCADNQALTEYCSMEACSSGDPGDPPPPPPPGC